MKKFFKIFLMFLTFILVISLCFSLTNFSFGKDYENVNNDITTEFSFTGKKISILGDSISTFDGYSNNTFYNSTIADNLARYPQSNLATNVNDTWWKRIIDYFNADLCVNNSWRGTEVLGADNSCGYKTRCQQLHNDNTNTNPDIIFVYMGINDIGVSSRTCGTFNSLYEIYNSQTGEYITPTTFAQAYAIMVHKIIVKYNNADVFLFTLPQNSCSSADWGNNTLRVQYNSIIRKIATYFDCGIIDFANVVNWNSSIHTGDGLHPNPTGMKILSDFAIQSLEYYYGLTSN